MFLRCINTRISYFVITLYCELLPNLFGQKQEALLQVLCPTDKLLADLGGRVCARIQYGIKARSRPGLGHIMARSGPDLQSALGCSLASSVTSENGEPVCTCFNVVLESPINQFIHSFPMLWMAPLRSHVVQMAAERKQMCH